MRIPKPTMGAMVITAAEFWILFSNFLIQTQQSQGKRQLTSVRDGPRGR